MLRVLLRNPRLMGWIRHSGHISSQLVLIRTHDLVHTHADAHIYFKYILTSTSLALAPCARARPIFPCLNVEAVIKRICVRDVDFQRVHKSHLFAVAGARSFCVYTWAAWPGAADMRTNCHHVRRHCIYMMRWHCISICRNKNMMIDSILRLVR